MKTLSITILIVTAHNIATLSKISICIIILSMMGLIVTLIIKRHNVMVSVAFFGTLSVVVLSVVVLSVVVLERRSALEPVAV